MATNNILPFCPTDSGTNLLTQTDYAAASDRTNGAQPGIASSKLNNKAARQAAFVSSQMAQYLANITGADVLDNGSTATLLGIITGAFMRLNPVVTSITATGAGTFNKTYYFFIDSGNATTGATYTNNAFTFTVVTTIASGTLLRCRGTGAPSVSGTLTKSGGTGDTTLTFRSFRSALFLKVRGVAAGGGGSGSGTSGTMGNGATGGNTTFGSSMLSATGGSGGGGNGTSGTGGTASLGTGPTGIAVGGAPGVGGCYTAATVALGTGASGGSTPFGGNGSGLFNQAGSNAAANSGSGGGGGGAASFNSFYSGGGGGAGGFFDGQIDNPGDAIPYTVGAKGIKGTSGTNGFTGGDAGDGLLEIEEHFQ